MKLNNKIIQTKINYELLVYDRLLNVRGWVMRVWTVGIL